MLRKITLSALTAAALVTSPITAPSAAANDRNKDFLLGLAALAIVGGVITQHNRRHHNVTPQQTWTPRHRTQSAHRHTQPRATRHSSRSHHAGHSHQRAPSKPKECLRQRWTAQGWQTFYSQRCLRRYGY